MLAGEPFWIAHAHWGDGKRFVVHADEKLTAFVELESAILAYLRGALGPPFALLTVTTITPVLGSLVCESARRLLDFGSPDDFWDFDFHFGCRM